MAEWLLTWPLPIAIAFCTLITFIFKLIVAIYRVFYRIGQILKNTEKLSRDFEQHLADYKKDKESVEEYRNIQIRISTTLKHLKEVLDKHEKKIYK